MGTIKVNTPVQKVLLDNELLGQFSDGFWENSRNQSWTYLNDVELISNIDKVGVYFPDYIPSDYKGYRVNNKELLSYVGNRMLAMARVANFFSVSDFNSDFECLLSSVEIENAIAENTPIQADHINNVIKRFETYKSEYWNKVANGISTEINKLGGIDELIKALNSDYTMKNMRKELTNITLILKNPRIGD